MENKKRIVFTLIATCLLSFGCNNNNSETNIPKEEPQPTIEEIHCESVVFDNKNISLEINKHIHLSYKIYPYNSIDSRVTFSSDNESVVSIDSSGLIETKSIGNANIKVTTVDGNKTDTCNIVVKEHVDKGELVIPTVDVESLKIDLPEKPVYQYNQNEIDTDGTYDYLNFYEVSDFHGATEATDKNIGLANMSTYFNMLRSKNPGGSVFLSCGDMFQGSAESNLTRGYLVNYAMNYMNFDAMAVGNHEFDWGETWLEKNATLKYENSVLPFLGANIIDKRTSEIPTFLKPSTIIERGNYKIGIIGTIGERLEHSILKSAIENFDFTDELEVVKSEAKKLKQEDNCDVVIWLSHSSVESLVTSGITKNDNVDAIFGGHAHVSNFDYGTLGIPVAATENYGRGIASIKLKINKNTKEVSNSYCTVLDNQDFYGCTEDENINSIINQYGESIDNIKNIKLGHTYEYLDNSQAGYLKDICVDAMQSSVMNYIDNQEQPYEIQKDQFVLAFHNVSGGIRSSIPIGDITYASIYSPFPFDNEIVLYKLSGYDVQRNVVAKPYTDYAMWHSFEKRSELVRDGEYYVATTDFVALSYLNINEDDLIYTGLNVRDEIARYVYEVDEIDITTYETQEFQQIKK